MDEQMQAMIGADLEVERRLGNYARARLIPGEGSKARARARIMREARLAFAEQADARIAAANADVARERSRRRALGRGAALLLAAGLSMGMVGGAMAASTAGGPLYGTRIWLEEVTLPSDPTSRASAEIGRLEARIAELAAAVRFGDRVAAVAALTAYQQIADRAIGEAGASGNETLMERLGEALDRHVASLERVADQVPPQAAEAIHRNIERAIQHNDAVLDRIHAGPTGPGPAEPSGPNGGAGAGAGAGSGAGSGAEPASEPQPPAEPAATAKPKPTPKVEPTPVVAPTPEAPAPPDPPDPTGKPAKTPHGQPDR
jgi:hypothetical protein